MLAAIQLRGVVVVKLGFVMLTLFFFDQRKKENFIDEDRIKKKGKGSAKSIIAKQNNPN